MLGHLSPSPLLLTSAPLPSTLGPALTEQQRPAETWKTERRKLRKRQGRDKQRERECNLSADGQGAAAVTSLI